MSRGKRCRKMSGIPPVKGFHPFGINPYLNEPVILALEEYESIKLADYDGLSQEEASVKMNVSRPTFTRIYEEARKKIAKALAEGRSFFIEGGNVNFDFEWLKCNLCKKAFSVLHHELSENTVCPDCGSKNLFRINDFFRQGPCCRKNWF